MPTGLHWNAALFSTALLATALAATPASAQKKYDTGATDTEIKIGNTIAYSGPASNYGTIAKAEAAYFNKINAEGGINGRKINFISYDDAYSPPKTVEQIRKLIEGDEVLFTFNTLGTPPNTAIQRYMNEHKVPQLFVGTGATKWGDPEHFPWTMGWQPTYQAEGRIYAKYILQNVQNPKIAIMYQNDDYGKDYVKGLKDGLGDKAKTLIVAEDSYETSEPTIDSHIVKLEASGANVFFDVSIAKFSAQAIKKVHELGWKPLHILNGVSTSIGAVMKPAGLDASQGVVSSAYLMDPTDPQWKDKPGMKEWVAFMDKWNPSADKTDAFNIYGYNLARTMVQVLKQCGDNLTRANVMKQAANLKNFEFGDAAARHHDQHRPDRLLSDRAGAADALQGRDLGAVRTGAQRRSLGLIACRILAQYGLNLRNTVAEVLFCKAAARRRRRNISVSLAGLYTRQDRSFNARATTARGSRKIPDSDHGHQGSNEMRSKFQLSANVLVTALGVALLASPASAQKKYDTGATDTEIKVGNTMPYSGPASAYGPIGKVEAAYFNKINAEGGINGRKINFISYDDAYSPPKAVEQVRKLVEGDEVLMLFNTLGTPSNTAIQPYLNKKGVPQLFVATGATKWGDPQHFPWTMGWAPTYQAEARIYAKYLLENKPDAKIAIMYQNDDYGKDYLKGFKDGLGDKAAKMIIAEESYEVAEPTIDGHVVRLQSSGANVFFNVATPKFAAQAIKKVAELGWKPLHIMNSVAGSIGGTLRPAGLDISKDIISATYGMDSTDPQWKDNPAMKEWVAFMDKWNPERRQDRRHQPLWL